MAHLPTGPRLSSVLACLFMSFPTPESLAQVKCLLHVRCQLTRQAAVGQLPTAESRGPKSMRLLRLLVPPLKPLLFDGLVAIASSSS